MASGILVMTAKELLDELLQLQRDNPDSFSDLAVYVEVIDQESYGVQLTATTGIEYTENVLGEGSAYAVQLHTPISSDGTRGEDYILIAAVELDD